LVYALQSATTLFPSTYLDIKHAPLPPAETPGPSDLTDEKLLYGAFEKAGFKIFK
jgi:hypothetical protein